MSSIFYMKRSNYRKSLWVHTDYFDAYCKCTQRNMCILVFADIREGGCAVLIQRAVSDHCKTLAIFMNWGKFYAVTLDLMLCHYDCWFAFLDAYLYPHHPSFNKSACHHEINEISFMF